MKIRLSNITLPVGLFLLFSICINGFFTSGNIYALAQAWALIALVAIGVALTMIAGEFDLSVGAVAVVSALLFARLGDTDLMGGVLAAVTTAILIGSINALLTVYLGVSSLVTTVGMMILLSGVAVWVEGGQVVAINNFELADWFDGRLLSVFSPRSLTALLVFGLVYLLLKFTRLGRDIYATGSHRKAASMAGANVVGALFSVFILSSLFASLSGVLTAISLSSASSRLGGDLVLQAATAAIVGGVALTGGRGGVIGVAAGTFVLAVLNNGLSLLGMDSAGVMLANGSLLLVILAAERIGNLKRI